MKIGIVTISYNQAKYLAEAIESVCIADPEQLEYVVVDPGSSDGVADGVGAKRRGGQRGKRAAETPEGRAGGRQDDGTGLHDSTGF